MSLAEAVTGIEEIIRAGEFVGKAPYISNELYHASPGLSSTGLIRFAKVPALFKRVQDDDSETASQRLGTLVHMKTLEPERFARTVTIVEGNGNSKDVKARIKEAEALGKYVCRSTKEYDQVNAMVDSVMRHEWARTLLTAGETEQSLFSKHPLYRFLMKCRPDAIHADRGIIADLKTFGDLDDSALRKQFHRMKYHWKAVHYLNVATEVYGTQFKKFAHIFVSTEEPYLVRVVALRDEAFEYADAKVCELYDRFAECLSSDQWPGYPDDVEDFDIGIL